MFNFVPLLFSGAAISVPVMCRVFPLGADIFVHVMCRVFPAGSGHYPQRTWPPPSRGLDEEGSLSMKLDDVKALIPELETDSEGNSRVIS